MNLMIYEYRNNRSVIRVVDTKTKRERERERKREREREREEHTIPLLWQNARAEVSCRVYV